MYDVPDTVNLITVNASPSISESLFNTPLAAFTLSVTSSDVVSVSAINVGVSFVGFTVIINVAVAESVPSETV